MIEENKHKKNMNFSFEFENNEYYHESNLDMNYYNSQDQKNEFKVNFFISARAFKCRKCTLIFSFNNQLHKHIRQNRCEKFILLKNVKSMKHFLDESIVNLIMNILIIKSTMNSFKNVRIEFEFRD